MQSYVCWYCSSPFSVSVSAQQSTKQWLELWNRFYISNWMGRSCSTNCEISIFHIPYVAVLTSVCSEAGERSPVYFSLVSVSRLMEEGGKIVSKILRGWNWDSTQQATLILVSALKLLEWYWSQSYSAEMQALPSSSSGTSFCVFQRPQWDSPRMSFE